MSNVEKGLVKSDDGLIRCWWCRASDEYAHYHDHEWGRPVTDDRRLFEKICLEGFQSGLSWLTILRKRENFREAFAHFEFEKIAKFNEDDVQELLQNPGIVRHQGKIRSTINNAKRAVEMVDKEGSLASFFWKFEPPAEERPEIANHESLSALGKTPTSIRLAKELKKRGWTFVGPTTAYAFMQAMGLVNDHLEGCYVREEIEAIRASFVRP